MSVTLYRKYRPQTFAEVVGREPITRILAEELKTGRVAHAYLFSGTRGTGKTTVARIFAKALNCTARDKDTSEPCNACASCLSIGGNRSQDLIEIDAASNRRIDEVRELREQVRYLPASSQYKVYIIDEVHMLTPEAFNALLKTLEEPPGHVVFVLATTELHKIPETIFSRCQHFSFGKIPMLEIAKRLKHLADKEEVGVDEDVIQEISRRAGGALRDAEGMLGQILSLGKKKITLADASLMLPTVGFARTYEWMRSLLAKDAAQSLKILETLEAEGVYLEFFLLEAIELGRQLMIYEATKNKNRLLARFTPEEADLLATTAGDSSPEAIRAVVIELMKASQDMKLYADIPVLPLELAVVTICGEPGREGGDNNASPGSGMSGSSRAVAAAIVAPEKKAGQTSPAPEKASVTDIKPVASACHQPTTHSLEDILGGWGEVLAKVKDRNQALNFILGVAEPVGVRGDVLEIGFKYRLQQEKISEFKNRQAVETIIKEVYGSSYKIEPIVRDGLKLDRLNAKAAPDLSSEALAKGEANLTAPGAETDDPLIKVALEVFSGAVVEG